MKTKISGKRPVMFFQEGLGTWGASGGSRIRILYPDGKAQWCALNSNSDMYDFCQQPCWRIGVRPRNIYDLMALANEFDKRSGFPKMEFLGEL